MDEQKKNDINEKIVEVKSRTDIGKIKKGLIITGIVVGGIIAIGATILITAAVAANPDPEKEKLAEEAFYEDPLKDITDESTTPNE